MHDLQGVHLSNPAVLLRKGLQTAQATCNLADRRTPPTSHSAVFFLPESLFLASVITFCKSSGLGPSCRRRIVWASNVLGKLLCRAAIPTISCNTPELPKLHCGQPESSTTTSSTDAPETVSGRTKMGGANGESVRPMEAERADAALLPLLSYTALERRLVYPPPRPTL
ncbi:unnamed protein product [Caenorhabditis auriculariae]|uniref:Uncharacterized protein n=1 Tax=Caenorhabditis auriculariae TaxID=2777116 RepID=A0A8S1GYQ9_9PELO|nr:unnamed protein product [Caenorhabditis auriculariae]